MSWQNYFWQLVGSSAIFGRYLQSQPSLWCKDFQWSCFDLQLWLWPLKSYLKSVSLLQCKHLCQLPPKIWTCTFREITTVTNQRSNQRTNKGPNVPTESGHCGGNNKKMTPRCRNSCWEKSSIHMVQSCGVDSMQCAISDYTTLYSDVNKATRYKSKSRFGSKHCFIHHLLKFHANSWKVNYLYIQINI